MVEVVVPEPWMEAMASLDAAGGPLLLLGAPDTGKTSFALALQRHWTRAGHSVHMFDLDLGQSEIGPPGAVGFAHADSPIEDFRTLPEPQIEFVGATSPDRNPTQFLVATALLWARSERPSRRIVDTDGHVMGPGARIQKLELTRLLRPRQILCFQRGDEAEPLIRLLERTTPARVTRLATSPHATKRSPEFRARRRQAKWARYFREAKEHTVSLSEVCFAGCRLGSGRTVDQMLADRIGRVLRTPVLHAEAFPGALWVVTDTPVPEDAQLRAQDLLGVQRVLWSIAQDYRGLLCGVAGPEGHTLALAILMGVDFASGRARLLSPVRSTQSIARVTVGLQRIGADFRDLGTIRLSQV